MVVLWASLVGQLVKNPPAVRETLVQFLGLEDHPPPRIKDRLATPVFMGIPGGSDNNKPAYNV